MDDSDFESRDAFLRKNFPAIANRLMRGLQTSGGFASGRKDPTKKCARVTGVVQIKRSEKLRNELKSELDEPQVIERECSDCGDEVNLSLSQAERMPPDATQCGDCFQQVLAEGFAALKDNGIILSMRAA
jgi:hypothetical protein